MLPVYGMSILQWCHERGPLFEGFDMQAIVGFVAHE